MRQGETDAAVRTGWNESRPWEDWAVAELRRNKLKHIHKLLFRFYIVMKHNTQSHIEKSVKCFHTWWSLSLILYAWSRSVFVTVWNRPVAELGRDQMKHKHTHLWWFYSAWNTTSTNHTLRNLWNVFTHVLIPSSPTDLCFIMGLISEPRLRNSNTTTGNRVNTFLLILFLLHIPSSNTQSHIENSVKCF